MRHLLVAFVALSLAGCSREAASPVGDARAEAVKGPVVVELFQSQGCSSCPPANANVAALSSRPDIIALSYSVTYWDHLGWKDTFAKPAFTERQRAYARSGQSDGVYTPQVVINGARAVVGVNRAKLDDAVASAPALKGPGITRDGDAVAVAGGSGGTADLLLVTYDPREHRVPVKAGENTGRTLPHRNIVVDLREIGTWQGKALRIALPKPPADAGLRGVVLLQQGSGGPILGAARI